MRVDVAVAGGGPAGLALAIQSAKRGLSTVVLERRASPLDKACGEGLMPPGLRQLELLGARDRIDPEECAPFEGIRYVQEDGSFAEARLPGCGGLGIRRIALIRALASRALEVGVELRHQSPVLRHRRTPASVLIETPDARVEAKILVAADGLLSPLRRAEGLERHSQAPRRFGLRQHYRVTPWSKCVEVHLCEVAEAYVTPAGPGRVGVAFLWDVDRLDERASVTLLRSHFPALQERLKSAEADSEPRGAGPLSQKSSTRTLDRFVLIGDAAGYVDAITGEGLSLAFACAATLGELLPRAIAQGATREALLTYERDFVHRFRKYALSARALVSLARHPALRRPVVRGLSRYPKLFESLIRRFSF